MAENAIALNLRRLRRANGLTQEDLAEKSGLSRAAYRNIESGKSEPRVSSLQDIAQSLQVPIQRLVEPGRALRAVRFRSGKRMRNREQILVDVGRWLGDFGDLEGILDDRVHHDLEQIRGRLRARKDRGGAAAALAREAFGLDAQEPVRDMCGLLESGGIKVGELKVASHDFFGLSVAPVEGGPAVIVNTWDRIPVERWIFTAAHELGHLILHLSDFDISRTDEEKKHEEEANAFTAAFLMPNTSFRKEWDATYGLAFVDRILKVKRIFRVSYRTVLYRLAPDFQGPGSIWVRFQLDYSRRYGRALLRDDEPEALAQDAFRASFPEGTAAGEPDKLSRVDFMQDRLSRLVRRAVEQEKISLDRGAEILGLSLLDMRELAASWVG
jgi:Zn-dependent peptidase ImmA (M78 family)/DNA-binding XRE family transcriptional regulator